MNADLDVVEMRLEKFICSGSFSGTRPNGGQWLCPRRLHQSVTLEQMMAVALAHVHKERDCHAEECVL